LEKVITAITDRKKSEKFSSELQLEYHHQLALAKETEDTSQQQLMLEILHARKTQ
jgi:hypothetical protein